MSRPISLLLCRYELSSIDRIWDAHTQHWFLNHIKGQTVAHRKRDATEEDKDTFVMRPKIKKILGETLLTWGVGRDIKTRAKTVYDREEDDIRESVEPTDEMAHANFFALPVRGVLAVAEKSGSSYLPASSAIGRFESIFKALAKGEARITPAGSREDVTHALSRWNLTDFSFVVRATNPHIGDPGIELDTLMKRDNIGKMRGQAIPLNDQQYMRAGEGGFIGEAVGLSEAGYGQFGLSGLTPEGRKASVAKPKFNMDKGTNIENQRKPRTVKVCIDPQASAEKEEEEVVRALLEFFGR